MIRPGTIKDFGAVERMLHDFHAAKAGQFDAALYDRLHFRGLYRVLMSDPKRGLVVISEVEGEPVGVLLAVATISAFAPIIATEELMWWVDPTARGRDTLRMLDAYEEWADSLGAKIVGLSHFGDRAPKSYARRGFISAESKHVKAR